MTPQRHRLASAPVTTDGQATCIGVDVGGTFTDVVLSDGGRVWRAKAPTTPDDVGRGVLDACRLVAQVAGRDLEAVLPTVERFGLGTTAVTNTLASWSGRRLGFITTAGFEDLVPLARGTRRSEDGWLVMPPTLVARECIVGVDERVDRDGNVVRAYRPGTAAAAARRLVDIEGADALTVSFLWSFRNPVHEQLAVAEVRTAFPELPVTAGAELQPAIREYERSTFALLNAYVAGSLRGVDSLAAELARLGLQVPVLLVHSAGGSCTVDEAHRVPIRLAASGPAAGVAASAIVAAALGIDEAITCDVGGTSYDVALVSAGAPERRTRGEIMGIWTSVPTVDVHSLGAGGGSLAWVDARGVLRVGPRSAGAVPGPVCYRRGGTQPTVTDALLVLGYLDPGRFLGGRMPLDVDAARDACAELGKSIGLDALECAWGIREIAQAEMVKATRSLHAARRHDPRDHARLTYGGCGPLFSPGVAAAIGARRYVVPALASVLSAFGAAATDVQRERSSAFHATLPVEPALLTAVVDELRRTVDADLAADGLAPADRTLAVELDLRFARQRWELSVPLPWGTGTLDERTIAGIDTDFRAEYARRYGEGALMAGAVVEIVAVRVLGTGRTVRAELQRDGAVAAGDEPPDSRGDEGPTRLVLLRRDDAPVPVAVHTVASLAPGAELCGPALVDDIDTTVWIPPGARAVLDEFRNLDVELPG
jgi:N-methylhydantoinase A